MNAKILRDKITLDSYSVDASMTKIKPFGVSIPSNYDEVKSVLDYCKSNERKIIIRGSGTNLVGNSIGKGVILDTSKLNKIISLDIEKKIVTVQSGVVIYDLNNFLARFNLIFPVIPSSHKEATIGGVISCNAVGRNAIKYGKVVKWVHSIKVMSSEGGILKLFNKDVEDFIGTEGSIGVILEAVLNITDVDNSKRSMDFIEFDDTSDMVERIKVLSDKNPLSIEFLNKKSAELLGKEKKYYLIIEYDGLTGSIKDKDELQKIWNWRDDTYPVISQKGYPVIEDPQAMDKDSLLKLLNFFDEYDIPAFGHIGVGIVHPCFRKDQTDLIDSMYELVLSLNCKITGEHGYGLKKKNYFPKDEKLSILNIKKFYDRYDLFYSAFLTD